MNDEQRNLFDTGSAERRAEIRRDQGMARAEAHAEHVRDGWANLADRALAVFLCDRRQFLAEEFVEWTRKQTEIQQPPDPRAWGAVIRRAALQGRIRRIGYHPANTSNRSPKCLWEKTR